MKKLVIVLLCCIGINVMKIPVLAEEPAFSVKAVLPKNQQGKATSYFDLKMKQGQQQVLEVALHNATGKDITILVAANSAFTNGNGIVDYNATNKPLDKSLQHGFGAITEVLTKEITVKAKSKAMAKINVKMPNEKMDGVILGGLVFSEKESGENATATGKLQNRFSYTIGAVLSQNDTLVKPNLNLGEIKAGQQNYRNKIMANLQNDQAMILRDLAIKSEVYRENGSKILFEQKSEKLRMAPNSNFDYAIHTRNQPLKPGNYTLKMTAMSGKDTWSWERNFKIDKETANDLNDTALDLDKGGWSTIGFLVAIAILLGLVIFMFWRQHVTKKKLEIKLRSEENEN
ncbi:DUF916 and DUF3324 domain-containing protein [Paenilisteria rocourtiae]|uniref:Uncharacterized protein DUF916 n=1 Tax=Listeria rocourtiae TaxID=647910 RepID=A0A4R6ZRV9_9LIST|nr:DUF916 and DUF3324 domain-containing protein [Listeria rocourtiae]EUJ49211.1 hypothetical protein PROCOU_04881 [Listeria rocourtiae FSL F6-920]MBC1434601.1 DUF916 and DUF3324 domain-containing protein [Listeria rocourtiae]MBC1603293.1 DUF916 and DUF3324 domain-containing protein [Listeria rocourtiae]TDR55421.1 uncharacterized protein DUF916 [Listeria rocourtiae]